MYGATMVFVASIGTGAVLMSCSAVPADPLEALNSRMPLVPAMRPMEAKVRLVG